MGGCSIVQSGGSLRLRGGATRGMCGRERGDIRIRMAREDIPSFRAWSDLSKQGLEHLQPVSKSSKLLTVVMFYVCSISKACLMIRGKTKSLEVRQCCHQTPLIPGFGRQRHLDLCEFKATMGYTRTM